MKKIKTSSLQIQNILSEGDNLLLQKDTGIVLLPWNSVLKGIKIGGRNYLRYSRTDNLTGWSSTGGTHSLISDSRFGNVVQWERISGAGDFQKTFNVIEKNSLSYNSLVLTVIAKLVSVTGSFSFGGWPETNKDLSNANKIDYGDGWMLYWATVNPVSNITTSNTFGINQIIGTWQFYAAGLMRGNIPCDWVPAMEDL